MKTFVRKDSKVQAVRYTGENAGYITSFMSIGYNQNIRRVPGDIGKWELFHGTHTTPLNIGDWVVHLPLLETFMVMNDIMFNEIYELGESG